MRKKVCGRRESKKFSRYGMDRITARKAPCGSVAVSSSRAGVDDELRDTGAASAVVDGESGGAAGAAGAVALAGVTGAADTAGVGGTVTDGISNSSMSISNGAAFAELPPNPLSGPLLLPGSHNREADFSGPSPPLRLGDADADRASASVLAAAVAAADAAVSRFARAAPTRKLSVPPLSPSAWSQRGAPQPVAAPAHPRCEPFSTEAAQLVRRLAPYLKGQIDELRDGSARENLTRLAVVAEQVQQRLRNVDDPACVVIQRDTALV